MIIAIFSGENRQDPLYPLFGKNDGAYLATLQYLLDNMTPLESTLIALNHMQVSVCHLRTRGKFRGLTAYRKNIISFPQELVEMKHTNHFFDTLETNDIVNVVMDIDETTGSLDEHCARLVQRRKEGGWLARVEGEEDLVPVTTQNITRRVKLPWKPSDVRDYFIVFAVATRRKTRTSKTFGSVGTSCRERSDS